MKPMVAALLAITTVSAALLSGCVQKETTPDLASTIQLVRDARAKDYHWPPLLVADSNGLPVRLPGVETPGFAESLLPVDQDVIHRWQGFYVFANPSLDSDAKGMLYLSAVDRALRSGDHGRTWETIRDFKSPLGETMPDRFLSLFTAQALDHDNGRFFQMYSTFGVRISTNTQTINVEVCPDLAHTDDQGTTWTPSLTESYPASCQSGGVADPLFGQTLAGTVGFGQMILAKPGPKTVAPGVGVAAYPKVLYICTASNPIWRLPLVLNPTVPPQVYSDTTTPCVMSWDGGDTFVERNGVYVDGPTIGGMPCTTYLPGRAAAYPDGTVALPLSSIWFNESAPPPFPGASPGGPELCPPRIAITEDSGRTWHVHQMPSGTNHTNMEFSPQVTVTPDGVAYYVYRAYDQSPNADLNHPAGAVYVVRSRDKFATWEGPFRVAPLDHTIDAAVSITSGSDGRIAVAYIGTRTLQDKQSFWYDSSTSFHLFVSTSVNAEEANPVFVTRQVTPEEKPVCVGLFFGCGRSIFAFPPLVGHDQDGRIYVSFTDDCILRNDCSRDVQGAYQAADIVPAVAIQTSGAGLVAGKTLEALDIPYPDPHVPTEGGH